MGPITFMSQQIASCGAKRIEGAKFTCVGRLVTCPACRTHVLAKRAAARAKFAATLASMGAK
jgi:hypothetical protein